MNTLRSSAALLAVLAIGTLTLSACSGTPVESPDVSESIRGSLDQAGFADVSVSQDREKGIVTLGGHVTSEDRKSGAASLAQSLAGAQVVANEIAVIPVGVEDTASAINTELDKGISSNLSAALIQNKMNEEVTHEVKNGVVTLSGEVASQSTRALAAKVAEAVPNVAQVVNELQIKNQKATSSQ